VKAIPAGAYVRIIGMNNLEEVDPADEPRTYRSKSYPRRMSVAVAGSAMHFFLAFVLMWIALVGYGVSELDNFQVNETAPVEEGVESPAQRVGLQPGDRIVAVDGNRVADWPALTDFLVENPGETVTLTILRDADLRDITVTLASIPDEETGEPRGFLGVSPKFPPEQVPVLEAVPRAGYEVADLAWRSAAALGSFFSPANLTDYADRVANPEARSGDDETTSAEPADEGTRFISPVGFVRIASQAASTGVYEVLLLLILINVFVGVFNMVPLLPFDGGHVAIATYERIRSRRGKRYHADVAKMLPFVYGVVMILGLMFLTSLWLDIASPLDNPFDAP
jgi:membrane-associated protease RseP (regulator of RpoE activity)